MNKCAFLLLFVLLLASASLAQSKDPATLTALGEKAKRFTAHQQDFIIFAKSYIAQQSEYDIANESQHLADRIHDSLASAWTLFYIHISLSCEADRAKIAQVIQSEINSYIQQLEFGIEQVGSDLARTKKPGMATTLARMKDDLREVKSLLESLKF